MSRSFLNRIEVKGNEGGFIDYLSLEYYGEDEGSLSLLPKRFSTKQDLWGYYNNNDNGTLLPRLDYFDHAQDPQPAMGMEC